MQRAKIPPHLGTNEYPLSERQYLTIVSVCIKFPHDYYTPWVDPRHLVAKYLLIGSDFATIHIIPVFESTPAVNFVFFSSPKNMVMNNKQYKRGFFRDFFSFGTQYILYLALVTIFISKKLSLKVEKRTLICHLIWNF